MPAPGIYFCIFDGDQPRRFLTTPFSVKLYWFRDKIHIAEPLSANERKSRRTACNRKVLADQASAARARVQSLQGVMFVHQFARGGLVTGQGCTSPVHPKRYTM